MSIAFVGVKLRIFVAIQHPWPFKGDFNSKFKFLWEQYVPKVCTFGQTLTLRLSLKMAKIKNNICQAKL